MKNNIINGNKRVTIDKNGETTYIRLRLLRYTKTTQNPKTETKCI